MKHYADDELVLFYYGESTDAEDVERHLDACLTCGDNYRALRATLQAVAAPDVPERDASYGRMVWARVSNQLPERRSFWTRLTNARLATAGAAALVLVAVFIAGRMWPQEPAAAPPAPLSAHAGDAQDRARIAAIGDHLDRSERVLLDVLNAGGDRVNLSAQQAWASDLIEANRFYKDAASHAGDGLIASVLDDLERSLLDVVHGPTMVTTEQLNDLRARVDAAALLFKVRVLSDELHERDTAPVPSGKTL